MSRAGRSPSLVRSIVRMLPREFRETYGEEMCEVYRRREIVAREQGVLALLRFRGRETGDLFRSLLREWWLVVRKAVHRKRETEMLQNTLSDVRFALRALLRRPGFSGMVVITLAIGIGASTAVFSVIDAVLLRPLPLPEAGRLVAVRTHDLKRQERYSIAYPDYQQWVQEGVFRAVGLYTGTSLDLTGTGEPERLRGLLVSDGFFSALGLDPVRGRLPEPGEYLPGSEETAVLSSGLWRRRFGGDEDVVGRRVLLNGVSARIVGILPPEASIAPADVWLPLRIGPVPRADLQEWDNYAFRALARLDADSSIRETNSRLASLAAEVAALNPREREGITIEAEPMLDYLTGPVLRLILTLLMGTVLIVLLIGCVNIASLMLTRASERSRELSVRVVLGAGRWRLVRMQTIEALVLALLGAGAGLVVASWGLRLLIRFTPSARVLRIEQAGISFPVLLFTLGLALLATLVFGVLPALREGRGHGHESLSRGGRTATVARRQERGRRWMVTVEVALSVILLTGAGMTIHSVSVLNETSPGFDTTHLLTVPIELPRSRYGAGEPVMGFYGPVLERIRQLPGVQDAALRSVLPLGGDGVDLWRAFLAEGWPEPPEGDEIAAPWVAVTPGLFRTERLPLLEGRDFTTADRASTEPVMVINRAFAERMFPGQVAVGKRVRSWRDENIYRTVVGVVENERHTGIDDELRPIVYVPHAQSTWRSMTVVARTSGDPLISAGPVRDLIHEIDPDLVVTDIATMEDVLDVSMSRPRFVRSLLMIFAGIALILAFLGVFGVLSYHVATRTREIGVRMAVGAGKGDVLRLLLQDSGRVIAVGFLLGLPVAVAEGWFMRRLLYGVPVMDLLVLAGVCAVLVVSALPAVLLPARRALRVDPASALRVE